MTIDGYVAALRRELRGPWLLRRSMLREVRDALDDAVQARREAGEPIVEAEHSATEGFGPVEIVAPAFREELAASAGRYLAALVVVLTSANVAFAQYMWTTAAAEQDWPAPTPAYGTFATAVDVANVAFVVVLLGAIVAMGRGARFVPTRRVVRFVAVGVLTSVLAKAITGVFLTLWAPRPITEWDGPMLAMMMALSGFSALWAAGVAWRCLWLTSRRRAGAQDGVDHAADLMPFSLPRR